MSLTLTLTTLIFSIVITYTVHQWLMKPSYKLPPGPSPWPIIGNLHIIKPVRQLCYADWSQVYGPIMSVWLGPQLSIVVSNSELAKQVLKDHDHVLANRTRSPAVDRLSSNGMDLIWADYGPHYVKVRKVCTFELFLPKSVDALRPIREDEVRAMVDSIFEFCSSRNAESLVLRKYLGSVAFNHITRLVFGKRFVMKGGDLNDKGVEFKGISADEMRLGASIGILGFGNAELSKHLARRDRLIQAIMDEIKIPGRDSDDGTKPKQSFVKALLGLQEKYDLTDETIKGLLWDMVTAGMDTVGTVVEFAMAHLVMNLAVQEKAQEEIDRVIGLNRRMTESDLVNLPYLQSITKEALRLHPPTPLMLPHRASADAKIGGYNIPKNTIVQVNVWAIGRDPGVWKDPLEFKPERFLETDVDIKGHDFRLLPFGAGRRSCPAAQLSINFVSLMIGSLLHQFKWNPSAGVKLEDIDLLEKPGLVSYMAKPLEAVPVIRLSPHLYNHDGL